MAMRYIRNVLQLVGKHHPLLLVNRSAIALNRKVPRKFQRTEEGRSYDKADFDETEYYLENGLRKVYPYRYVHEVFCKERWVGKKLFDVWCQEFHGFVAERFYKRIEKGDVQVNGCQMDPEYVLQNGDFITSAIHRHEQAVLAVPIKIIADKDDFVVIEKPHSIPVHPVGAYRHNSVLFILGKEHGIKGLYTNHRIDRLTSGILILTRSSKKCYEFQTQLKYLQIKKTYVCRVDGDFPDGEIVCKQPLKRVHCKNLFCVVDKSGKVCVTKFRKLSYNGKSSVVLCEPVTGRTHQIRLHLQYLGYPIVGDTMYNNDDVFGPGKAKGGIKDGLQNLVTKLEKTLSFRSFVVSSLDHVLEPHSEEFVHSMHSKFSDSLIAKYKKDKNKFTFHEDCYFCNTLYRDPTKQSLTMYLHALKYEGEGWGFETDMPKWALPDWTEN